MASLSSNGLHYGSLQEAVNDSSDNDVVTLLSDADVSSSGLTIPAGKSVTFELFGSDIIVGSSANSRLIVQGSLSIQDGFGQYNGIDSTGKIVVSDTQSFSSDECLISVENGGHLTMFGGYIDADRSGDTDAALNAVGVKPGGFFQMQDGRVVASGYAVFGLVADDATDSQIVLQGGELISNNSFAVCLQNAGRAYISGSKVYGAAGGIHFLNGSLQIACDAFITSRGMDSSGAWGAGEGTDGAPALLVDGKSSESSVCVNSGMLTAGADENAIAVAEDSQAEIEVSGGIFSSSVPSEFLHSDYVCIKDDGNYLVVPKNMQNAVAVNFSTYYSSVSEAIDDAGNGSTVVLLRDASLGSDIYEFDDSKQLSLDLGGNTLTGQIHVINGRLTVSNGVIESSDSPIVLYGASPSENGAVLFIEDDASVNATSGYGIYAMPADDVMGYGYKSSVTVYGSVSGSKAGIKVAESLGASVEAMDHITTGRYPALNISLYNGARVSGGSTGPGIDLGGYANVCAFEGSSVSGTEAVRVKTGYLSVMGGCFSATGPAVEPSVANNAGDVDTGAAISITSGNSVYSAPSVSIFGGLYSSANGPALYLGHESGEDGLLPYANAPELSVSWGGFDGKDEALYIALPNGGDASYGVKMVSGGCFTSDPSIYVSEWSSVREGSFEYDGRSYPYYVDSSPDQSGKKSAVREAIVDSSKLPETVSETQRDEILTSAASVGIVDDAVLSNAASQCLGEITESMEAQARNAYRSSGIDGAAQTLDDQIIVYAQAYLKVTPLGYDAGLNQLTIDIAPMYRIVASTETDGSSIQVQDEAEGSANAVVLPGSDKSLTIFGSYEYSIACPSFFGLIDSFMFERCVGDSYNDLYRRASVDAENNRVIFSEYGSYTTIQLRSDERVARVKIGDGSYYVKLDSLDREFLPTPEVPQGTTFVGWSFEDYGVKGAYKVLTDEVLTVLSDYYSRTDQPIIPVAQFDPPLTDPEPEPTPDPDPTPTPTPTPTPDPDGDVVTNPDGSTTTTTTEESTDPDTGDVTTVMTEVTEGREDGSVTTVVTETVKGEGGQTSVTVTETTELADGTVATATSDGEGRVSTVKATVSADAAAAGPVALPVPALTAAADEGSATEISVSAPEGGATVVVPIESASPSAVLELVGADGSVTVLPKVALSEDGLTVALEEGATLRLVDRETSFPDVSEGDWFAGEVAPFVSSRGILTGVVTEGGATEFQGGLGTDRAMFVTMLHRLELEPDSAGAQFGDVPEGAWYAQSASWGEGTGVVAGYGDGTAFGGTDPVTREQMAVFMYRYAQWLGLDTSARAGLDFPDGGSVSSWAEEAMSWAVAEGLFGGDTGTGALRPTDGATRAEAAAVIMRLVNGVLL